MGAKFYNVSDMDCAAFAAPWRESQLSFILHPFYTLLFFFFFPLIIVDLQCCDPYSFKLSNTLGILRDTREDDEVFVHIV